MALPWDEREALREQYPDFYVDLLLEVLQLVDDVEARHLTANEAVTRANKRFCELMEQYVPECRERVAAYRGRIEAEQAERNKAAGEYEEKRVRANHAETIRIDQ